MYSDLVSYVCPSPNCTAQRTHPVDTITVHHVAGDASVEALGALFADPKRQASSNYGIGSDGRIACFVPEESRSWCSGSRENDMRAITVEVANSGGEPDWPVSEAAWESLVALLADVCRRYGFPLNFTGDKTGNLTMHKWFQPTACPGPYLENRFPLLAQQVNERLQDKFYRVQCGAFNSYENAVAFRDELRNKGYGDAFITEVRRDK